MARANRAERRAIAAARRAQREAMRANDPRLAYEPTRPAILPGLPGGAPYVSERELEQYAEAMFNAVAVMHPGMEARRIMGERLRLNVVAPRARASSELLEIHARLEPGKGLVYE